jgi:VanZ family protein
VNVRFGLLTTLCLALIYWLSSLPDVGIQESPRLIQLLWNLAHIPVFAALAYGVLKTLSGSAPAGPDRYLAAFFITGGLAALDEWHQSFVPGRSVSAGDLLLDLTGIAVALLVVRLRSLPIDERCEAR